MMYCSDLGFICYIHELRKRSGRESLECILHISANCLLGLDQLFDLFLLDKSNLAIDVPENDNFTTSIYV
jgi:hypothetical protein